MHGSTCLILHTSIRHLSVAYNSAYCSVIMYTSNILYLKHCADMAGIGVSEFVMIQGYDT